MPAYLKRLDIDSVEEVGVETTGTAYLKRVEIVEVVDRDGNPWEPVPGPDPWDELVVASDTYWSNLNDYSPGSEVFAHPAVFTGGNPENTTYRYRWQYQADDSSTWNSGSWTSYNNGVLEVSYVIPNEAAGGKVRLMSQARDTSDPEDVIQVNSFVAAEDVAYMPLVVSATTLSGLPYVGETITCAQPAVTGGQEPYAYNYMWLDQEAAALSPSNTTVLGTYDLGKLVSCYVGVSSADGQSANTTTPTIGPVDQYTIGTLTRYIDFEDYPDEVPVEIPFLDTSAFLNVVPTGNSPNINYSWSLESGDARLTDQGGGACSVIFNTSGGVVIKATAIDNNSLPSSATALFEFLVTGT